MFPLTKSMELLSNACSGTTAALAPISESTEGFDASPWNEKWWPGVLGDGLIGIVLCDASGRYLATNSSFQKILGNAIDDISTDYSLLTELVKKNGRTFTNQKCHGRKEGRSLWLNISLSPLPADQYSRHFFVCFAGDITERTRTEDALHDNDTSSGRFWAIPGAWRSKQLERLLSIRTDESQNRRVEAL